jgi:diguanylate cyclase (GGDEF)-like protein
MLVMLLDIDHFKKVNDTWGHDAGDIVLQRTATAMRAPVRDYDKVSRYGGEEFLVICPGAGADVAADLGDRIRRSVERNAIATPEFTGSVTISIGVSVRNPEHQSTRDMLHDADEALYAAKDAGRNKVCIQA